ncbi:MAG: hypothetical protein QNJ27_05525 [Simkaniaceae bacterium]|nr:hypothetical protein [Simkaniaceae bacterium]
MLNIKRSFLKALVFSFFSIVPSLFGDAGYTTVFKKKYQVPDNQEMRTYEDIALKCGKGREANFTISLPENIPPGGLPTVLIVGGLKTGRESLQFIPNHGQYAFVAYEYPQRLKTLHKINVFLHIYTVRKAALEVPKELIAIIKYLRQESWINQEPISLMGYSFGATFLPVTYVNAQKKGIPLGPGVIAYGGAGIYCLFKANLPLPNFLKKPLASMAAAIFKPIDPILYAPHMKGGFLIINGIYDSQIPLECADRLQNLVPEPKTVINLETQHMSPENLDVNLRLINISRQWLEEKRQLQHS